MMDRMLMRRIRSVWTCGSGTTCDWGQSYDLPNTHSPPALKPENIQLLRRWYGMQSLRQLNIVSACSCGFDYYILRRTQYYSAMKGIVSDGGSIAANDITDLVATFSTSLPISHDIVWSLIIVAAVTDKSTVTTPLDSFTSILSVLGQLTPFSKEVKIIVQGLDAARKAGKTTGTPSAGGPSTKIPNADAFSASILHAQQVAGDGIKDAVARITKEVFSPENVGGIDTTSNNPLVVLGNFQTRFGDLLSKSGGCRVCTAARDSLADARLDSYGPEQILDRGSARQPARRRWLLEHGQG